MMMQVLALLFALAPTLALAEAGRRCEKPAKEEPVVYSNEFHWGQNRSDMQKNFEMIYESGKRLLGRAYYNEASHGYEMSAPYGVVKVDPKFIASVTRHLEISLQRGYAEQIFFPDMGHSHFYIPEKEWPALAAEQSRSKLYEKLFALRSLKILYHTAEQLQVKPGERSEGPFPQDPVLLWRYFSRNVFADNNGGENVGILFRGPQGYNSVGEVEGYNLYSAGFYVSASKDGCFPYSFKGKTYYFDLAIEEMPYDNSKGEEGSRKSIFAEKKSARVPASTKKK
ncbi:MAG: hypothetical protein AB7K68_16565 [Bacteriovoracia bacterium]